MSSGPLVIGPRTAVAGNVLTYSVPTETAAIYVQNYSKLTLLVSFAATAPTATDSLNNQYDGVLAPGGRDTFYVQSRGASAAERSLNAMGAFTGNVWIMPVDRTANQANTGMLSTVSDVWLSAYGPYDPPPPFPGGMPLNVDLSSQPRVIVVPMSSGAGGFQTGRVTCPTAGNSQTLYNGWNVAGNTGTGKVFSFYLYAILMTMGFNGGGAGGIDLSVSLDLQNAANVSLGLGLWPQELIRASLSWPASGGPYQQLSWPPVPWPQAVVGSLGGGFASADHLAIIVTNNGSTNAPGQLDFTMMAALGAFGANNLVQVPGPIGLPSSQGTLL